MKETIRKYILTDLLGNRSDTTLTTSEDILSTGIIDSMGAIRLISFVEELTGVSIPPEDMVIENFVTIDAIESYIKLRKN